MNLLEVIIWGELVGVLVWDETTRTSTFEYADSKLLQYAIEQNLTPIALTEFWWGRPIKTSDRKHAHFYPACKNKCRPILEFMLEDDELFDQRIAHSQP